MANSVSSLSSEIWTGTAKAKRQALLGTLDNFATFKWRGVDMFDEFGAFIVNDSDNLKFYNGGSFSNSYASTTFQSRRGELDGVSFTGQEISFTVGVYWFTEDDWRRFLHFMNPYEMSDLSFGFDNQYRYFVKLSSNIGDSDRHLLGYQRQKTKKAEMIEKQGGTSKETENVPAWYTEFTLKFDVLEESVAMAQNSYTFYTDHNDWNLKTSYVDYFPWYEGTYTFMKGISESGVVDTSEKDSRFCICDGINFDLKDKEGVKIPTYEDNFQQGFSDLDMPISTVISFHLNPNTSKTFKHIILTYTAHYVAEKTVTIKDGDKETTSTIQEVEVSQQLFKVILQHLTVYTDFNRNEKQEVPYQSQFNLQYNSEEGMLYWLDGQQLKVLTLLTTNPDGLPIISQLSVNRFRIPGCLEATNINYSKIIFTLTASPVYDNAETTTDDLTIAMHNTAYARTTII